MTFPAHKDRRYVQANACDVCHTQFIGARQLITHLHSNPSHVRSVELSGRTADRAYGQVGR